MPSEDHVRRLRIEREAEGYLELGMPEKALDALARLDDPPGLGPKALFLRGEAFRELNRYGDALVPLEEAAEAMPENVPVWFALAWCYKRTDRLDRAVAAMEKALAASPEEALAHYNLACYLSLAGEKNRALECLARAIKIAPACRRLIDDESDFDPLRSDRRFQELCAEDDA